jgi:hypothetical protein
LACGLGPEGEKRREREARGEERRGAQREGNETRREGEGGRK